MAFDPATFKAPELSQAATKFDPNTFKDPSVVAKQQEAQRQEEIAKISPTKSALIGFGTAIADQAYGLTQAAINSSMASIGLGLAAKSGVSQQSLQQNLAGMKQSTDTSYNTAKEAHPAAAMLGYGAGVVAPAAALPGSSATGLWRVGEGAAMGADLAGTQYVEGNDPGTRLGNMAMGGAIGAAVPAVAESYKGLKSLGKELPGKGVKEVADLVGKSDDAVLAESQAAMQRSGIHLTPGEATQNPALIAKEGHVAVSPSSVDKVLPTVQQRNKAIIGQAKGIADDLIPEGKKQAAKVVNELYEKSYPTPIKDVKAVDALNEYPMFGKIQAKMVNDLGPDMPKAGTVGYVDTAKKYLDDEISAALKSGKSAKGAEVGALQNLKTKLVKIADDSSPDYATARQGAQKLLVQKKLGDNLKAALKDGEIGAVGAIRNAWFGTQKKSDAFYSSLKQVTDDKGVLQRAKDLETILGRLKNSKYDQLLAKDSDAASLFNKASADGSVFNINTYKALIRHQKAKGIVNLISNPNWADELSKLANSKSSVEKTAKGFSDILTKTIIRGSSTPSTDQ